MPSNASCSDVDRRGRFLSLWVLELLLERLPCQNGTPINVAVLLPSVARPGGTLGPGPRATRKVSGPER
jgi:hypothetical protein